ncbi:unnamed protein product [Phytophthora fragariaefolia]|uniref:RxLR effector protein n=1 Tax=Phytophthora fragariaefolia TaxID=1490495 RepID=A0A9W7CUX6_9STRA|nr:unnamed protein product [Phytophthora fragariaefolia]
MRLHYLLAIVVATLATTSGAVSAVKFASHTNPSVVASAEHVRAIDVARAETRSRRFLRTASTNNVDEVQVYKEGKKPQFIEQKLQKALSDPNKNKKLYKQWYESGFTVKQVEGGLRQSESRELEPVYTKLSLGYAKYFKARRSQEAQ